MSFQTCKTFLLRKIFWRVLVTKQHLAPIDLRFLEVLQSSLIYITFKCHLLARVNPMLCLSCWMPPPCLCVALLLSKIIAFHLYLILFVIPTFWLLYTYACSHTHIQRWPSHSSGNRRAEWQWLGSRAAVSTEATCIMEEVSVQRMRDVRQGLDPWAETHGKRKKILCTPLSFGLILSQCAVMPACQPRQFISSLSDMRVE